MSQPAITPDLVSRTPVVDPKPQPQPEPEIVHFSPEQQAKLDEIVKSAMGRAAAEVRKENAKLKAALDAQLAANNPNASEVEKLQAQYAAAKLRIEDLTAERQQERLDSAILTAAHQEKFVDPVQAGLLLDRAALLDEGGNVSPEKVAAAVKKLADASPHLIRSSVKSGAGSTHDQNIPQPPVKLESLFGRGSNAAEANRLAIRDPQAYTRLRAEARRKGLI